MKQAYVVERISVSDSIGGETHTYNIIKSINILNILRENRTVSKNKDVNETSDTITLVSLESVDFNEDTLIKYSDTVYRILAKHKSIRRYYYLLDAI